MFDFIILSVMLVIIEFVHVSGHVPFVTINILLLLLLLLSRVQNTLSLDVDAGSYFREPCILAI